MRIRAYSMRVVAVLAMVLMAIVSTHAAEIFYESFEDPVINGNVTNLPAGWTGNTNWNNMSDDITVTGKTGGQFAMVHGDGTSYAMKTTTNILSSNLTANTRYTLTCDVGWSDNRCGRCIMQFFAGSTELAVMTNEIIQGVENDFTKNSLSITFVATNGHPNIGQTLSIGLSRNQGWGNSDAHFDNLSLDATSTTGDSTAPTPDPMVFDGLPTSSVSNSITMQAAKAVDVNGVQYFFTNTVNGHVSGWQDSPVWTDTGLIPDEIYSYKVRARDKSANMNINTTQWSSAESAQCKPYIILYESFENPSIVPQRRSGESAAWRGVGNGITWTYWAPPGWDYDPGSALETYNEGLGTTNTPFGAQFVGMRAGTAWIAATNLGYVFQAGYTYRITCNLLYLDTRSDLGNTGEYKIDLISGGTNVVDGTVVASNVIASASWAGDFSDTLMLEYYSDPESTNLDDSISIKLSFLNSGFYGDKGCFDNVKVYAIPPPKKGTRLIIR